MVKYRHSWFASQVVTGAETGLVEVDDPDEPDDPDDPSSAGQLGPH